MATLLLLPCVNHLAQPGLCSKSNQHHATARTGGVWYAQLPCGKLQPFRRAQSKGWSVTGSGVTPAPPFQDPCNYASQARHTLTPAL